MKKMNLRTVKTIVLALSLSGVAAGMLGVWLDEDALFIVPGMGLLAAAMVFALLFYRCPHCGRLIGNSMGKYCTHCGKNMYESKTDSV